MATKKKKSERGGPIRNAARTRARILREATRLFAQAGFEGASVRDIVSAARVNRRMLFHYFGDKRGLYREVFITEWRALLEQLEKTIAERLGGDLGGDEEVPAGELLMLALEAFVGFIERHRALVKLMMWEGLEGGAISRSIWKEARGPLFTRVVSLIEQVKRDGDMSAEVDAADLIVTFLGAVTFYFAYAHTMPDMIGKKPFSARSVARRKAHLGLVMQRMLEPGAREGRPSVSVSVESGNVLPGRHCAESPVLRDAPVAPRARSRPARAGD